MANHRSRFKLALNGSLALLEERHAVSSVSLAIWPATEALIFMKQAAAQPASIATIESEGKQVSRTKETQPLFASHFQVIKGQQENTIVSRSQTWGDPDDSVNIKQKDMSIPLIHIHGPSVSFFANLNNHPPGSSTSPASQAPPSTSSAASGMVQALPHSNAVNNSSSAMDISTADHSIRPMGKSSGFNSSGWVPPINSMTKAFGTPNDSLNQGSGSGGDAYLLSGSGSGGQPGSSGSGAPPIISTITSGLTLDRTQAPNYTVTNGVPVGTVMQITLAAPTGKSIQAATWSGGTNVSAYFNGDPEAPAPMTMKPTENVSTNGLSSYTFVVDAKAREYTISIDVTYAAGGGTGKAQLKFQSIRPDVASLEKISNPVPTMYAPLPGTLQYLEVDPMNGVKGMEIRAKTKASPNWGGQFMIMQTTEVVRSYTNSNGVVKTQKNEGDGSNIDVGASTDDYPIGCLLATGDSSWTLTAGQSGNDEWNVVNDPVPVSPPDVDTDKSIRVGTPQKPESFVTYLMYRPPSGISNSVWVAVAKLSWGWGGAATNTNGVWQLDPNASQNPTSTTGSIPSTPNGGVEWPTWTGRTKEIQWKP